MHAAALVAGDGDGEGRGDGRQPQSRWPRRPANHPSDPQARRDRNGAAPRRDERFELLTPRELEIAALAAAGFSNAQMATALFISVATVKDHLQKERSSRFGSRDDSLSQYSGTQKCDCTETGYSVYVHYGLEPRSFGAMKTMGQP